MSDSVHELIQRLRRNWVDLFGSVQFTYCERGLGRIVAKIEVVYLRSFVAHYDNR